MHQDLGDQLSARRSDRSLRLEDASILSGLSVPTIRRLEGCKGTLSSLLRYTEALSLSLQWHGLDGQPNGKSISQRRQKLKISQRQMAKSLGVSHRTVISLENQFKGRVETYLACMAILNLRPRLRDTASCTRPSISSSIDDELLSVLNANNSSRPKIALLCGDALSVQVPAL